MKKVFFIILFAFYSNESIAQYYTPGHTINTPYGTVNTPGQWHYSPMYFGGGASINSNYYEFTVYMKSDSVFKARAKIDFYDSIDHLVIGKRKNEIQIEPSQTKGITRITKKGGVMKGIPADSCWLFKVNSGAINTYSFLSEESYQYTAIAVQKGDNGDIVALSKENLLDMIGEDNKKLVGLIEKNQLIKAIRKYNKNGSN